MKSLLSGFTYSRFPQGFVVYFELPIAQNCSKSRALWEILWFRLLVVVWREACIKTPPANLVFGHALRIMGLLFQARWMAFRAIGQFF